jgi:hypothetical protein
VGYEDEDEDEEEDEDKGGISSNGGEGGGEYLNVVRQLMK